MGWIQSAFKWFTDLLSPVQSTKEDLDSAASAGKKFGEWLAFGIDLALKPLQLLIDGIKWVIDNMPGIQAGAKIVDDTKQARSEETNRVIKSGSTAEKVQDAFSDTRAPISARPVATQPAQPMTVTININAAQGMDERALAQQVAKEMQRIQNQQQARARSSLWDK